MVKQPLSPSCGCDSPIGATLFPSEQAEGLGSHVPAKLSQSRALVATVDLKIIQIGINSSIHHHPHHNSPSPSESITNNLTSLTQYIGIPPKYICCQRK